MGKGSGRRGRTVCLIRRKTNSWETTIGDGKLDPHTSPVPCLLLFPLAFCSADVSWGWGDSVRTTAGGKHPSPQGTQWGRETRGSSPEPWDQTEERDSRWQMETSPFLLTSACLATLMHPPVCSPHLTQRPQSAGQAVCHRLSSWVPAGSWKGVGLPTVTRVQSSLKNLQKQLVLSWGVGSRSN